jgi:hypothetical protein
MELHPTSFQPKFNLAELDFVEKKWAEAYTDFAELITYLQAQNTKLATELKRPLDAPVQAALQNTVKSNDSTIKLMQYKQVISLLKQGKTDDAKALTATFSYLDDEPLHYFAHAAHAFAAAEAKEKTLPAGKKAEAERAEAQTWLDSANRIYPQALITIYLDSMIEVGWVETLGL